MSVAEDLAAPFEIGELKFFPGPKSRDGHSARVMSYIDARAVMDRLDKVVSPAGWQTSYRVLDLPTCAVECQLTVMLAEGFITKADVGYPNDADDAQNPGKEPLKAAYSDALKRAGVQFGIGRYIYGLVLERDYLPLNEYGKFTEAPRIKGAAMQPTYRATEEAPPPAARAADLGPVSDVGRAPARTAEATCGVCNGPCYDNRADKRSETYPDFKCKAANCKAGGWLRGDGSITWKR